MSETRETPTEDAVRRGRVIADLIGRWTTDPYATLVVVLEAAFDAGAQMAGGRGER